MEDYRKYLQPETISKLRSIELKAKFIVEGFLIGLHKSPYHGFSVEFSEHRQYSPGDEIRHIDWRVYGRTDKFYIKRYEEETNLRGYILLDVSGSMRYTSGPKYLPKIEYASYLSAALCLLMLGQRDGAGLVTFSDTIETFLPPSAKPSHQRLLLKTLSETSALVTTGTARQTDSGRALSQIAERIQKRSLIILISDLWDNPDSLITALKFFRHRHNEVIVFHLIDPQERLFDFNADAEMVDMETGSRILTSPRQIQQAYEQAFNALSERYKQALTDNLIDYNLIDTSKPFDLALFAYLKKRSRLK
ncbi:MAG: DUF58 domain-containing protein [Chlorobiales bacterium]|nr:DUF58 domain-containing protein [Chlorobiales bacterium]